MSNRHPKSAWGAALALLVAAAGQPAAADMLGMSQRRDPHRKVRRAHSAVAPLRGSRGCQGLPRALPLDRAQRRADRRFRSDHIPGRQLLAQGRDVVAWAHPTTGVAEGCAPTRLPDLSGNIAGLEEMLERGYVVAATDYPGLGSMGTHPYLIGVTEAHAVLFVRAARELPDAKARDRFIVWGHSQGGHAALFTGN